MSEEEDQVYCICRTSNVNRFMIGCDNCEEWYHGDCVNVSEREAKYIKRYYCKRCRLHNPKLSVVYKTKKPKEEDVHKDKKRKKKDKDRDPDEREIKKQKKENRAERLSSVDSRLSESSKKHRDEKSDDDEKIKSKNEDSEDAWEPTVKPSENKSKKVTSKSSKGTAPKKRRGRKASGSDGDANHSFWDVTSSLSGARHCFGHKCKKQAREGSKYCSDNCGMNLASLRIMQTLPDRIREWNMTPCEAEKRNRRELDSIRAKQETVKATLEQLNRDFRTLEELITRGKAQLIEEKDEDDEDDTSAAEMTVHCVTCGSDVQTRTAIRHMERCYNKIESQTSFASRFKTQIDDERMFCDFYNPKEGTYCKRLQVLCPEHNPDEKRVPRDDEVCGYPISKEVFGKPTEFCRSSKKACVAHYCWEKLRRAELDMERVKQWMKVDELLEQERQIRAAMSNRAGVLGLLLHSTFNHEIEEKLRNSNQRPQIRPSVHSK